MTILIGILHSIPVHDWLIKDRISWHCLYHRADWDIRHWHSRMRWLWPDASRQNWQLRTAMSQPITILQKELTGRQLNNLSHPQASSYLFACNTKGGNEWMSPVISIPHPSPSLKRTQRKGNFLSRSVSLQNHWLEKSHGNTSLWDKAKRWSWLILLAFLMWEKRGKERKFAAAIVRERYRW